MQSETKIIFRMILSLIFTHSNVVLVLFINFYKFTFIFNSLKKQLCNEETDFRFKYNNNPLARYFRNIHRNCELM